MRKLGSKTKARQVADAAGMPRVPGSGKVQKIVISPEEVAVKKAGWTAIPARDGIEALDLIERASRPPDLVLLDIEMPRMDGFEFLSTVRSHQGRTDLPIVMLTSRSGEKHRDKATALGATDYMVKPFQEDALVRNIDRLVQASRQAARRAAS